MYVNAEKVLPPHLLRQIQQYVQGAEIYIPKEPESRVRWGENSGSRRHINQRNEDIIHRFRRGESIASLMEHYHLGYDSIRKIVQSHRK